MEIKYKNVKGCKICTSHSKNKDGYINCNLDGEKLMHRYIYKKTHGDIPEGLVIMHTCDNRGCINKNHLMMGTHADNVADRVKKNRSAIGVKNGRSKLTVELVKIIYKSDDKISKLANDYGVDHKTIRGIKNKTTWKFIWN